jgi:hypothetical protein
MNLGNREVPSEGTATPLDCSTLTKMQGGLYRSISWSKEANILEAPVQIFEAPVRQIESNRGTCNSTWQLQLQLQRGTP